MNTKTFSGIYPSSHCKGCPHAVKNRIAVFSRDEVFLYNSVEEFIKYHNFRLFPVEKFLPYTSNHLYTCDLYDASNFCKFHPDYLELPF